MSEPANAAPTAWLISDGAAGNARQCQALARAMGLDDATGYIVQLPPPWRWFAPRLTRGAAYAFRPALAPPWPDIAIGCGRQAALLTRVLRQYSGGRTFTVQILDPRVDPALFDAVVAPQHDRLTGANVLGMLGAVHGIDTALLLQATTDFYTLRHLPQPRTALLVGGPRRGLGLDAAWLDGFVARLETLLSGQGGSLMVTTSRRTPPAWRARLHGAFSSGCVHFWDGPQDGPNPYLGYLAYADRIVVTPDSVNMLSEACAVGVPVLSSLPPGASGKIAAFHTALKTAYQLHELGVDTDSLQRALPLRETPAIATALWERYRARISGVPAVDAG